MTEELVDVKDAEAASLPNCSHLRYKYLRLTYRNLEIMTIQMG